MKKKLFKYSLLFVLFLLLVPQALSEPLTIPSINLGLTGSDNPEDVAVTIQILFLLTVLSLAPSILVLMTAFTRIIIVLSFVRHGLATQQMPPNQVLIGLALFLTLFIMTPVLTDVNDNALQPYLNKEITQTEAIDNATKPVKNFMFEHTRKVDLAMFVEMSKMEKPETKADIPLSVLVPSFVISELKTAFQIGFLIFIPFLVIDMIVASVLMSMGMMMLPPMMISLPFKILLFILVDGWHLVVKSLVLGF